MELLDKSISFFQVIRNLVKCYKQFQIWCFIKGYFLIILSHDIASWDEITPCNKIDKPLVLYRFSGNVMK